MCGRNVSPERRVHLLTLSRRGGGSAEQGPLRRGPLVTPCDPLPPRVSCSLSPPDHSDRVRETLGPQEGHERDLQGEVPPHQADAQQDQEVPSPPFFTLYTTLHE